LMYRLNKDENMKYKRDAGNRNIKAIDGTFRSSETRVHLLIHG